MFALACTVVVLTCFVMCGCFGNMYTCIYCVLYCTVFFVLFRLCIFILIFFLSVLGKVYCHRMTTQLRLVVVTIIIITKKNSIPKVFSFITRNLLSARTGE